MLRSTVAAAWKKITAALRGPWAVWKLGIPQAWLGRPLIGMASADSGRRGGSPRLEGDRGAPELSVLPAGWEGFAGLVEREAGAGELARLAHRRVPACGHGDGATFTVDCVGALFLHLSGERGR